MSQQEQQDRGSSLSASMSLLTSLLSRPLDPGYEAAARKKALEGPRRRSVPSSIVLVLFAAALGALTAIRSAGQAVLVDLVPLTGPYVVEAIGDPERMPTRFAGTPAGDHLALLRAAYDIPSTVEPVARLVAPAGSAPTLVRAAPAGPLTAVEEES